MKRRNFLSWLASLPVMSSIVKADNVVEESVPALDEDCKHRNFTPPCHKGNEWVKYCRECGESMDADRCVNIQKQEEEDIEFLRRCDEEAIASKE